MNAVKAQSLRVHDRSYQCRLQIRLRSPATKTILLVEEQVARSLPILDRERGQGLILCMEGNHAPEVNRADHIDIVQNERFIQAQWIVEEKPCCFLETAARVQQNVLAGDLDPHSK